MADDDDRAKARARVEAERQKVRDAEAEKALRKMASEGADMAVGNTDPPPPPPPPPPDPFAGETLAPSDQELADAQRAADEATRNLKSPLSKSGMDAVFQGRDRIGASDRASERLDDLETKKAFSGCSPGLVAVLVAMGVAGVVIALLALNRDSGSTKTAAGAPASSSDKPAGLDGHWVLVDGLQNTYADMGLSCSHICDEPGRQLTVDQPSVTIDISGDKVTGGTFKTGYTSTLGDPCTIQESRVDATVSGNVDPEKAYGQLIVDGTEVRKAHCDSDLHLVVEDQAFHTSRFFFVKDDTLTLCYNIDPNTFDSCNTNGLTANLDKIPSGTAATFKRG